MASTYSYGVDEQALRDAMVSLADDEILALCYAFKSNHARLRLYADMLRRRGGGRAQFASCLICYDLARQGDLGFQREFELLAPTMRSLAAQPTFVDTLLGTDAYLMFIWDLCRAALEALEEGGATAQEVHAQAQALDTASRPLAELVLLEDKDLDDDFGLATDDVTLRRRFDDAVHEFLGGVANAPMYERGAGFRLDSGRDVQRIETFLARLGSLRDVIPQARGYRALVLLFYGTQLRSRTLFGGVNQRKQQLLRDGLSEFMHAGMYMWRIVGVLGPLHCAPGVWDKIVEVLVDFVVFSRHDPDAAMRSLDDSIRSYQPVGRLKTRY